MTENEKQGIIPMRLVSFDQVADIICKYENRSIQKTMIYELGKLSSVPATEEQLMEIRGNEAITFDD